MHEVLHFLANVGLGLVVLSLMFMALSNLRIAVDAPAIVGRVKDSFIAGDWPCPLVYEYLTRQRAARLGWYGRTVQRECILANLFFVVGGLALWPDILIHLWYAAS
ncbi:hypothetical protein Paz_12 [Xylella phage Paz]|uniref:Uncharacterized protein n=1 Tax=Xylella phage Paz TaxID=1415145 RepID=V5Q7L1_9CAUD|nr:hypothetical protein Paz_12 [Xylella phage Paz]AHB12109.1 hypothetical protein Paz_12 [Xylella phage Paz]